MIHVGKGLEKRDTGDRGFLLLPIRAHKCRLKSYFWIKRMFKNYH